MGRLTVIGTTYRIDYKGSKTDMCAGKIPVAGPSKDITQDVVCPAGYIKQKIRRKDKCRKQGAAVISYPNK